MKKIITQNLKVGLFVFSVQFFVGLIFLYKNFTLETVIWTALLSCITTLVFIIVIALVQAFYMKSYKVSLKNFDVNPTQSATFSVDKTLEEVLAIIENEIPEKINSYKFKYDKEQNIYKAKTSATIRSWGEIVIIKLTKIDNYKIQLSVLSKSILKTTLIDYGKSSLNIQKIKLAFEKI
ncbi:MAG: hypothetical protein WCH78_02790 [Bacteroidota bacterium]